MRIYIHVHAYIYASNLLNLPVVTSQNVNVGLSPQRLGSLYGALDPPPQSPRCFGFIKNKAQNQRRR